MGPIAWQPRRRILASPRPGLADRRQEEGAAQKRFDKAVVAVAAVISKLGDVREDRDR